MRFPLHGVMRAKSKKLVPISVRLEADVRQALEAIAAERDRSLSWLLNEAARQFVEANAPSAKARTRQPKA